MTICSNDVLERLTKLGYTDAVTEIERMLKKDKTLTQRWKSYDNRMKKFANNFGAWDAHESRIGDFAEIELEYEECGHCPWLEQLAKDINGDYYESVDEDILAEVGVEGGNTITVSHEWFYNVMHLWINKYKDYDFDIYQSKLI